MRKLAQRVLETPSSATVHIADTVTKLRQQGVDIIDFSAGRAAEHSPDYINQKAAQALLEGDTHQTMARGKLEFREACARKLERENGITADPEKSIIATLGCKQGLTLALLSTINPGDEVIVEDPCFVSYKPLIRLCGGIPVAVPLRKENNFRWTKEKLEAAITVATCSSLASLAVSMDVAEERMKLPRSVYAFTLPMGTQINKDGTSIMLAGVLLFTAQAAGIEFSLASQVSIVLVGLLLSTGAGGIPGGGLVVALIFVQAFHLPLEIAVIVSGIYRLIDMGGTTINCMGDLVGTVIVTHSEGKFKNRSVQESV